MPGVYPAGSTIRVGGESALFGVPPDPSQLPQIFSGLGLWITNSGSSGVFYHYLWIEAVTEVPLSALDIQTIFGGALTQWGFRVAKVDPVVPDPPGAISVPAEVNHQTGQVIPKPNTPPSGKLPGPNGQPNPNKPSSDSLLILGAVLFAVVMLGPLGGGSGGGRRRR